MFWGIQHQTSNLHGTIYLVGNSQDADSRDLFFEVMRNFFPQAEQMLQIGYWFSNSIGWSICGSLPKP